MLKRAHESESELRSELQHGFQRRTTLTPVCDAREQLPLQLRWSLPPNLSGIKTKETRFEHEAQSRSYLIVEQDVLQHEGISDQIHRSSLHSSN